VLLCPLPASPRAGRRIGVVVSPPGLPASGEEMRCPLSTTRDAGRGAHRDFRNHRDPCAQAQLNDESVSLLNCERFLEGGHQLQVEAGGKTTWPHGRSLEMVVATEKLRSIHADVQHRDRWCPLGKLDFEQNVDVVGLVVLVQVICVAETGNDLDIHARRPAGRSKPPGQPEHRAPEGRICGPHRRAS